jgi:hypothetical protein
VTQVLVPVTVLLRRAYAVELIGAALVARAGGWGHCSIGRQPVAHRRWWLGVVLCGVGQGADEDWIISAGDAFDAGGVLVGLALEAVSVLDGPGRVGRDRGRARLARGPGLLAPVVGRGGFVAAGRGHR